MILLIQIINISKCFDIPIFYFPQTILISNNEVSCDLIK